VSDRLRKASSPDPYATGLVTCGYGSSCATQRGNGALDTPRPDAICEPSNLPSNNAFEPSALGDS